MRRFHRVAFAVTDKDPNEVKSKSFYTRIGVSFLNKDDSETVVLDALPVNGRIILQAPKETSEFES